MAQVSPPSGDPPASAGPRDALLDAAVQLFRARGYEGVGVADLIAASGFPRGSLYFHFPGGKEQIGREAMARAGAEISRRFERLREAPDLDAVIERMFEAYRRALERSDFSLGCGVGLVALEMSNVSTPLRAAAAEVFADWMSVLASIFRSYQLDQAAAERLARASLGAVQGAIVLARAMRSMQPLDDAALSVRALARSLRDPSR